MKTSRKTTWDKIKIGEVFAWIWGNLEQICYKINNTDDIIVAGNGSGEGGYFSKVSLCGSDCLYKLLKADQRKWKEV